MSFMAQAIIEQLRDTLPPRKPPDFNSLHPTPRKYAFPTLARRAFVAEVQFVNVLRDDRTVISRRSLLTNHDPPLVDDGVGPSTVRFHPASSFIARALIIGDGNRST